MKAKAERLAKYINEGVLSYMEDNEMHDELNVVVEKLSELNEGSHLYDEISIEGVINEFELRGELSYLAEAVKECIDIVNDVQELDLNALKKMLKLRDWATVDDVVEKVRFLFC